MPYSTSRDSLEGQRVLVTGSSRGLGAEIASSLAAAGAKLMISGRNAIGLEVHAIACSTAWARLPCPHG
jgi:NAD(P)-dependent dehydrogenase (short-subunit alcohol dehydrogenase family)